MGPEDGKGPETEMSVDKLKTLPSLELRTRTVNINVVRRFAVNDFESQTIVVVGGGGGGGGGVCVCVCGVYVCVCVCICLCVCVCVCVCV